MKRFRVTFYPENKSICVKDGERIIDAAIAAGIHINSSCGGQGLCGRCRVIIEDGYTEFEPSAKLSSKEVKEGLRLACLTKIKGDLEIRIPLESRLLKREESSQVIFEDMVKGWKICPLIQRTYLELPPPTKDDNIDDLSRLNRGLRESTGQNLRIENISLLRNLGTCLREGDFKVTLSILSVDSEPLLVDLLSGKRVGKTYAICVDIGTTTVATSLVDLTSGQTLDQSFEYNAQISCGEDVISRIIYASKKGGLKKLQDLVVDTINGLIQTLVGHNGIDLKDLLYLVVAGNTTMIHLFLGINPRFLRQFPYVPTAKVIPPLLANKVGLKVPEFVYLFILPSVASFMGADIVSGILGTGIFQDEALTLYVDIGTNSEVVLGNREYLLSCSTSAGPAFEGGGIKYGMRAAEGAIDGVRIDRETLEPDLSIIGDQPPVGICGSGLIEAVAEMFEAGIIDERGKFNCELGCSRIRRKNGIPEYILAGEITINEVDLDNLIRAKAAIYAGICVLLDSLQVRFQDIDRIIISGNFGRHLNIKNASKIGLLPPFSEDKFMFVGNAPLLGARLAALSKEMYRECTRIAESMTNIELADNLKFMDEYMAGLFLPHTDMERFQDLF